MKNQYFQLLYICLSQYEFMPFKIFFFNSSSDSGSAQFMNPG